MELFPTNIAIGNAFCNRTQERKLLRQYLQHGRHTVLIAPRRYGKTSLINQVLSENHLLYCLMELTLAINENDLQDIIIKHTSQLLFQIMPHTSKAKQIILNLFKWLNPELTLTVAGQKLVLHPEFEKMNPINNIVETLKKLDEAAGYVKKKLIIAIDEFQQITEFKNSAFEAAIRHVMQYSKNITYVFSGSNRHMLQDMFNNKNRPFYNSCEIIRLERIHEQDYMAFIQNAAKKQWQKNLPAAVIELILNLTECHPAYVNRVCGHFWLTAEFPTEETVTQVWNFLVESKRSEFTTDLLHLSANQRKLLSYLAVHPTKTPSKQEVSYQTKLPETSIRQALQILQRHDFVHKDQEGYFTLLDPALKWFIKKLL